jgi:Aminoglycoside-2''-adenylyltransferase
VSSRQLHALARVDAAFTAAGIDYWVFGGWAVDFHARTVTREHDDVDVAVWLDEMARITALLVDDGWSRAPEPDEDGGTGYERDGVRLELTYLVGDDDGVHTPFSGGRGTWPDAAFGEDVLELRGTRARVIALEALKATKSRPRDDPGDAAKDRADFAVLSR